MPKKRSLFSTNTDISTESGITNTDYLKVVLDHRDENITNEEISDESVKTKSKMTCTDDRSRKIKSKQALKLKATKNNI